MDTISTRVTENSYNISPQQFHAGDSISLTYPDLYKLTLSGKVEGEAGQYKGGILKMFSDIAEGICIPDGETLQSLFEMSFGYGFSIDAQGYDRLVLEAIEAISEKTVRAEFGSSIYLSETGRVCFPKNTIQNIIEANEGLDPRSIALMTYIKGFTAGVVGRKDGRENFAPEGYVDTLTISIDEKNLLGKRRRILEMIKSQPALLLTSLVPTVSNIKTLNDLSNIKTVLRRMLPGYVTQRIGRVTEGKKSTNTTLIGGKIVSFWAKEYEDSYIEIAERLFEENGSEDISIKSSQYKIASELGEVELIREVLTRDIQSNNIPKDLENLINIFLLSEDTSEGNNTNWYEQFCIFIESQYSCNAAGTIIEEYMAQTPYWNLSQRKQTITPDTYSLTAEQYQQINEINTRYRNYFESVVSIYNEALLQYEKDPLSRLLIDKLEGGLPPQLIPVCRRLMNQEGAIDSLRFDLIPDKDGKFWVGETQIISGGTPPAVLYRSAFEACFSNGEFVEKGILPVFVEKVLREANGKEPLVAILYSERPYSSDISKTTSWAGNLSFINALKESGINARYCFPSDLTRKSDGKLYFANGDFADVPITTIYNRVDYVSDKAINVLYSEPMRDILDTVKQQNVGIFPFPYPVLFGKGVYALIWDPKFEALLKAKIGNEQLQLLRSCTPPTYWVDSTTNDSSITPCEWIRKGSYNHATLGLVVGIDSPELFRSMVEQDLKIPYSAVVQWYVDSSTPPFRVLQKFRDGEGNVISAWVREKYRLRVEPTSIDGKICEVFVTGNKDRVVHGRETSIMTVSTLS